MSKISEEIGSQIRHFRKKRGMTLSDLSKLINKNIATISKYEKGEIVIDIETLYEIAGALHLTPDQLLYHAPTFIPREADCGIPNFFNGVSKFYSYVYDGRTGKVVKSAFDIISQECNCEYKVIMYMNFKDFDHYKECESTYIGKIKHFDAMTYISLVNKDTPMEEASIQILASYQDTDTKWGLFNGFSARPMMPIAMKMLFTKNIISETDQLVEELKVSKNDIQMLKLYNMFSVM